MKLADKKCIPSKKGQTPFSIEEAEKMMDRIHAGWELIDDATKLSRSINFKNFSEPMKLAVEIGEIAENENHHPDLCISWGKLGVIITTHLLKGLVESDFIFAAKVDEAVERFR